MIGTSKCYDGNDLVKMLLPVNIHSMHGLQLPLVPFSYEVSIAWKHFLKMTQ